jgi:hypothetical protein
MKSCMAKWRLKFQLKRTRLSGGAGYYISGVRLTSEADIPQGWVFFNFLGFGGSEDRGLLIFWPYIQVREWET